MAPVAWHAEAQAFGRILLYQGDITTVDTTAIVNAANSSILGGGGVDGAIHRAGGPAIVAECRQIRAQQYPNGLPTGEAVLTNAGELPAEKVIHTVGPIWQGGYQGEALLLANCYRNSLRLAAAHQLDSVAFSAISTGDYGYPKPEATAIAVREVRQFLESHELPRTVVFVTFDDESHQVYEQELSGI
ncbi:O-acetyl-ADP-ribose deacetylase [Hymenobacter metallicola]|uniref:O-acetyl-ADP-ribose deacetylase n=1 Tax=Hymenobacter metallicola TaxID=2563114 RepID=A0A4Z0Q1B0_9BACT|nr:O-acetyl-ADP-ribose deacetylase [Hymenobacter metallicola]TGE23394.1 O-acetyl-ADP-ribose deacetylase [Hymenobacter metallicola]